MIPMGLNQPGAWEPAFILELCVSLLFVPEASLAHSCRDCCSTEHNRDHATIKCLVDFLRCPKVGVEDIGAMGWIVDPLLKCGCSCIAFSCDRLACPAPAP